MISVKSVTDAAAIIAAFEPDIAVALAAYNVLKSIWTATNPGKTEADYLAYLTSSSQVNVDTTSAYLVAQGYVAQPDGSWKKL